MTRAQRLHIESMIRNQPGLANVTIGHLARVSERYVRKVRSELNPARIGA